MYRKSAEVKFQQIAAIGAFTKRLLEAALQTLVAAFTGTDFLIVFSMATINAENADTHCADDVLYVKLYKPLNNWTTREGIGVSLADHVTTNKSHEQDTALSVLV